MGFIKKYWLNTVLSVAVLVAFFAYMSLGGGIRFMYEALIFIVPFGFAVCIRKKSDEGYYFFDSFTAAVLIIVLGLTVLTEIWYFISDTSGYFVELGFILMILFGLVLIVSIVFAGFCFRLYCLIFRKQGLSFSDTLSKNLKRKITVLALILLSVVLFWQIVMQ